MDGAFACGGKASCRMRGKRDAMSIPNRAVAAPLPAATLTRRWTGGGPLPMAALIIGVIVAGLGIGALVSAFQNRATVPELAQRRSRRSRPSRSPGDPVVRLTPTPKRALATDSPSSTPSPSRRPAAPLPVAHADPVGDGCSDGDGRFHPSPSPLAAPRSELRETGSRRDGSPEAIVVATSSRVASGRSPDARAGSASWWRRRTHRRGHGAGAALHRRPHRGDESGLRGLGGTSSDRP